MIFRAVFAILLLYALRLGAAYVITDVVVTQITLPPLQHVVDALERASAHRDY